MLGLCGAVGPSKAQVVGWWKFDERPVGTVAGIEVPIIDYALGNNAQAVLGPVYIAPPSMAPCFTQGLALNGNGQFVRAPDRPEYAMLRSMTVEAVFSTTGYINSCCGFNQIVFRGDDRSSIDPFFLGLRSDNRVGLYVYNQLAVLTAGPVALNVPVHIAATLDDRTGAASIYVNGLLDNVGTTSVRPDGVLTGPRPGLGFGSLQSDFLIQYLSGSLYEVRISNQALLPGQFLPGLGIQVSDMTLGLVCRFSATSVSASLSPSGGGVGTSTYQWEIADPNVPGGWRSIVSGVNLMPTPALPGAFVAGNVTSATLSIGPLYPTGSPVPPQSIMVRCTASNACGTAVSRPVRLTACAADVNCGGGVSVQDVFDFVAAWFTNDPRSDFNGVNGITVQDIFDFLAAWFAGC